MGVGLASATSGRGSLAPPRPAPPAAESALCGPHPREDAPGVPGAPKRGAEGGTGHPRSSGSCVCEQEKRRLQEEIGAARRELEEEKLRVERLKVGDSRPARAVNWGVCVSPPERQ